MLIHVHDQVMADRRRKLSISKRRACRRPIEKVMEGLPDLEISVASDVQDPMEILYKPRIGQEEFERLILSLSDGI